jgi:UPF0271 protein
MELTPGEIYDIVAQQIGALGDVAREEGVPIAHVKPHGALYNDAVADAHIARAVVRAVHDFDRNLMVYGLAGSRLITETEHVGMRAVAEAFADRGYEADGTLTPRGSHGALMEDATEAAARVVRMAIDRRVRANDGSDVRLRAETICIHGDGTHAVEIARQVRAALLDAGVRVAAPGMA